MEASHCGACGKACQAGGRCEKGVCVGQGCGGSETLCESVCVDLQKSAANCGACGQDCGEDEICEGGRCKGRCAAGEQICGGQCVDGMSDRLHCGACGRACGLGEDCIKGRCEILSVCPPGSQRCGGGCVDLMFDDWHCGGCDQRCSEGWPCLGGRCVEPTETIVGDAGEAEGETAVEGAGETAMEVERSEETRDSGFVVRASGCLCGWVGAEGMSMWGLGFWVFLLYRRKRGRSTPRRKDSEQV